MSYFHPQRTPVLPARRRKAARLQLEQVVAKSAGSGSGKSGRRIGPAVVAAGTAAIVLATGAAAIAVAVYRPVTNKTYARCFTMQRVSGFATTIADPAKPGTADSVRNARTICAALFRQGYLRRGARRINPWPGKGAHPVPPLTVCTWQDGTAAVFPGGDGTCATLGLPAAARR